MKDPQKKDDVILLSSNGKGFYNRNKIEDKKCIIDKWKVVITYAMSGGNKPTINGDYQVISSLQILAPNEVCTETYLVLNTFNSKNEASNMCSYVKTKIFRFLLLQALSSIHITKDSFQFVPLLDFTSTSDIDWCQSVSDIDRQLYAKYGLSDEEIAFIEKMIKPME